MRRDNSRRRGALVSIKKEFPGIVILRVNNYKIQYSRTGRSLWFKLLLQFPKVVHSVWAENTWLKKIINQYQVDAVFADNRFGFYSTRIPCIYITHQLQIKTGNLISDTIVRKIHYHFIKKYTFCWVPDFKENGLAGKLSHPAKIPSNVVYVGPLSRFEKINNLPKVYSLLVALSGPEPQRSIFEKMILRQLQTFRKKVLLVRGLPSEDQQLQGSVESIEIVNHLSAAQLNIAFQQSEIIISRSGYSTIMDLVKLGRNAILVPTPGQTEQEYLASYLMEQKYFYSVKQQNFSLETSIEQSASFPFITLPSPGENYKKMINDFVLTLKPGNFASINQEL